MATIQIPNHSHCVICGKAVPFGDKTCSKECEQGLEELNKKRKRSMLTMYVLMGIAMLVLVLSYVSPGLVGGA